MLLEDNTVVVACPYCGKVADISLSGMTDGWNVVKCVSSGGVRGCQTEFVVRVLLTIDAMVGEIRAKKTDPEILQMPGGRGVACSKFLEAMGLTLKVYDQYKAIPENAGVYMLWTRDTEQLDYIGETRNVLRRLSHHTFYRPEKHTVGFISVPVEQTRKDLEAVLISRLRPVKNIRFIEALEGEEVDGIEWHEGVDRAS